MSDTPESHKGSQPKPKSISLDDLLPAKASVRTSIGTLYIRYANTSDWKSFEIDDADELGRAAVRQLSSRVEDKHDSDPLAEKDLNALTEVDYHSLAPVISKQSGWGAMPAGAGLKELGDTVKAAKKKITEHHKKRFEDIYKSIDSNYRFLGKDALERLQNQMAGLVDLRSALSGTSAIERAMRDVNFRGIASSIEPPKTIEIPQIPNISRFEDTPLGQAALESAKNSREATQKMADLVDIVAGLNQTLVQDVLPAWFKQIEKDQNDAKEAFNQAAKGLWWTKWAVITSVFVTIAATWVQINVARDIDHGNSEQQKQSEAILREQLVAQQKFIEQQALDAAAMREVITAIKIPAEMAVPKK